MKGNVTAQSEYLQGYLQQVWSAPMLSREREVELATRMKEGGRVGQRARDELVVAHLKLATSLARKYSRSGRSFEDLVQEANVGLLMAVDKFDVERGFRFATYAYYWVRQQLNLFVTASDGDVRIPLNRVRDIRKLKDAIKALESRRVPVTDRALASEMKVSVEVVRDITDSMIHEVSLNTPIGEGATEYGDLLADSSAPNPEQEAITANQRDVLMEAIATLPERDRQILIMRYGLGDEEEHTLEDISAVYGVTRERIRQLEVKAIEKLRGVKKLVPSGKKQLPPPRHNTRRKKV